jgi:hypothetical protein
MSVIKITLPGTEIPVNGKSVSFKAPCSCTNATALQIDGVEYTIVDALGNDITGSIGYWEKDAIITVVLDVTNARAYLQNSARTAAAKCERITLLASKWSSTGYYSFEDTYPAAHYDLTVALDGDNVTVSQKHAYDDADIVGLSDTNRIRALGTKPTVNIPVIVKAVFK